VFTDAEFTTVDQRTGLSTPLEPHLEPTHGSTTVAVSRGEVLHEASLPSPDSDYDGYPKWTCSARPRRLEPLTQSGPLPELAFAKNPASVPVFSKTGLAREQKSNCAGMAVIAEANAGSKRDLLLLIMGTLISLGAAVAVEVLLDWRHSGGPLAHLRRRRRIQPNVSPDASAGKDA
jgi:hypothetical protein